MKKLIFICEGPTEQFFCKVILENHFLALGIEIEYPLILHSNGGIVKWEHIKTQIGNHYSTDNNVFITTFIDYYGMYDHHNFPDWTLAEAEPNKSSRMTILETALRNDINHSIKFIPYIQVYEFEALVFSKYLAFEDYYDPSDADYNALENICINYPNPEDINNSKVTAPSKRLLNHIPRYLKTIDGIDIIKSIGLEEVRNKCPRFNDWITILENI